MISNSSITYNHNSTERYIILNDLVFGTVYNISVAAVNSVGRGPFSDPMAIEIGIGICYNQSSNFIFRYFSVPGPVGSVSGIMDTTWAVVSWVIPSFIPRNYSIITYEIGYHVLQSNSCSMVEIDSIPNTQMMIKQFNNESGANYSFNISGLTEKTCYVFAVRAYTINGYSEWVYTTNKTLPKKLVPNPSSGEFINYLHS